MQRRLVLQCAVRTMSSQHDHERFMSGDQGPMSLEQQMQMRREQEKNRIDQEQREKLKKPIETDTAEDVSFQDNHVTFKTIAFCAGFLYACWRGHCWMREKQEARQAFKEGRQ